MSAQEEAGASGGFQEWAGPRAEAGEQLTDSLRDRPEAAGAASGPAVSQAGSSDHGALEVLTAAECYELISPGGVGRVAFTTADGPVVLPVNYAMAGQLVIFRTAPDTLLARYLDCRAGFEVDRIDEALGRGWSVLVIGHAVRVTSEAEVSRLERHAAVRPWAAGARDVYVRITPHQISGRRIAG